jgi:hypothetical protein
MPNIDLEYIINGILLNYEIGILEDSLFLIYYSFIHICIHYLSHSSPLPPTPPSPQHPPLLPGRTCSALISNFVEEKT